MPTGVEIFDHVVDKEVFSGPTDDEDLAEATHN
jgi:hypothetical protein